MYKEGTLYFVLQNTHAILARDVESAPCDEDTLDTYFEVLLASFAMFPPSAAPFCPGVFHVHVQQSALRTELDSQKKSQNSSEKVPSLGM